MLYTWHVRGQYQFKTAEVRQICMFWWDRFVYIDTKQIATCRALMLLSPIAHHRQFCKAYGSRTRAKIYTLYKSIPPKNTLESDVTSAVFN